MSRLTQMSRDGPLEAHWLEEPLLAFADGGLHVDPREGIARYGPWSWSPSRRHPSQVRVGFIGTGESMSRARAWFDGAALGIPGQGPHLSFPGFMADRGFFSQIVF